jgi:hypothetical protein
MMRMAPPEPPLRVAVGDDDGLRRIRYRLWQVSILALTFTVTAWTWTLPPIYDMPILGIGALLIAKHVIIAVLVMGLGVDRSRRGRA